MADGVIVPRTRMRFEVAKESKWQWSLIGDERNEQRYE